MFWSLFLEGLFTEFRFWAGELLARVYFCLVKLKVE